VARFAQFFETLSWVSQSIFDRITDEKALSLERAFLLFFVG
jgi:hypothetical protein